MNEEKIDVVIIGAGLSGLISATLLHRAGLKVRVIEARSRIGGRILSGSINETTVDLGGQWIGPQQNRIKKLINELGLSLVPQFNKGRHILELNKKIFNYRGLIPNLPLPALVATSLALKKLNYLASQIDPKMMLPVENLIALDSITAEEGIQKLTKNLISRELLRAATRAIWCAEPIEISWLWFLGYVRAGRSIEKLLGVKGGAQQSRVIGGAWQITERLSHQLVPNTILLSTPVKGITRRKDLLNVQHSKGSALASSVIMAIAPSMMCNISCDLPGFTRRTRLAKQMPMGRVIKSVLAYPRPFWRDMGFSGQVSSNHSGFGPIFDACQPGQSHGLLVGFFEAGIGENLDFHERASAAHDAVERWFQSPKQQLIGYTEHDWTSDPWSGGCYGGIPTPGALSSDLSALRVPRDGLHWASTETATEWTGYMEGAIQAGFRAASEIIKKRN